MNSFKPGFLLGKSIGDDRVDAPRHPEQYLHDDPLVGVFNIGNQQYFFADVTNVVFGNQVKVEKG